VYGTESTGFYYIKRRNVHVIYVHKSLKIESVGIESYCKEKDLEACAIKLNINSTHICIITTYSAPSGNFNLFINNLESILRNLYNPALELIMW
jgi:hypothetical protein